MVTDIKKKDMTGKQTKYDTLIEFIKDINLIVRKVNLGTDMSSDHIKLKEMFIMVGINEDTIDNMYLGCGFDDHRDYIEQRNYPRNLQRGNVSCTKSQINGLSEAVVDFINCEIAKDKGAC